MNLSPRPRSFARFAQVAVASVVVLAGLVSAGCTDNKIGRRCDLDTEDAGTSGTTSAATINSQAVECPSRICLQPAKESSVATAGGLCTASCSSDDDCSDGQTSTSADQCHTGFACLVATTVGDFCCQRLCVCRDFVDQSNPSWQKTPPVCEPGQSTCKNVH
jgi:hypothetical protein